MSEQYTSILSEEDRYALRQQRIEARKKKLRARRRKQLKQILPIAAFLLLVLSLFILWRIQASEKATQGDLAEETPVSAPMPEVETIDVPEDIPQDLPYSAQSNTSTVQLGDTVDSSYAVVIDLAEKTILAEKDAYTTINPASMTKVLTLLVAAEHITNLDDTVTITIDITDYCFVNECSVVGFAVGETATIRELLYGTILPSGADDSLALANYVAGSHEAFVELMNAKLEELSLSDTAHFTNCVGLYHKDHFCTIYDMAIIMNAAMENELCREVLKARTYETAPTPEHPDGQVLSNWFLRRIEDRFTEGFEIIGGKTGYVVQSGSCAVSCGESEDGKRYVCATGDSSSSWQAIYDHTDLYQTYCS